MKTVLFVCIHNSARSQMAAAFARALCPHTVQIFSAGLTPGQLNPLVVQVMAELDMDISRQPCRSVAQHLAEQGAPDLVVTVCDEASAAQCPVLPGAQHEHWGFEDPSSLAGDEVQRLQATRVIRDQIQRRVAQWCATL